MRLGDRMSEADKRRLMMLYANNSGGFTIPRAGLAASFDASLGITSSGGFASAWADQSGNGRNLLQATGANQPIHLSFAGTKYGYLPAVSGNYFSTNDSVANSVTGDIALVFKGSLADWTPATASMLGSKWIETGNQRSYGLYMNIDGRPRFLWSSDGAAGTALDKGATAATSFTDGAVGYLAATLDVDNGAGGNDLKFWTSSDGATWSQLGSTVTTAGTTSIFNGTAGVEIGSYLGGTALLASGKPYSFQIYNGIPPMLGGSGSASPVVDFDPSRWTSGTTFPASTGETWTINSTGSKPAQIVDRSSLLFDGAAHYMKCAAFTLNQPETVYLVAKQVTWVNNATLFDGDLNIRMAMFQDTSSPNVSLFAGSVGPTATSLSVGAKGVVASVFNGASSSIQVNGGAIVTGNVGASNAGGFMVGARAALSQFSNIQVYEGLIYNVAHDAATRSNIIRALMSKHGVA